MWETLLNKAAAMKKLPLVVFDAVELSNKLLVYYFNNLIGIAKRKMGSGSIRTASAWR